MLIIILKKLKKKLTPSYFKVFESNTIILEMMFKVLFVLCCSNLLTLNFNVRIDSMSSINNVMPALTLLLPHAAPGLL